MLHARLRAAAGNRGGIPTDGLIAHYTMDNISGSTVIDEQGSYNGTLYGGSVVSGAFGDALDFPGTGTDRISLPTGVLNPSGTIVTYFNADDLNVGRRLFDDRDVSYFTARVANQAGKILFRIYDQSSNFFDIETGTISLSAWHKLSVGWDSSEFSVSLDDVVVNAVAFSGLITDSVRMNLAAPRDDRLGNSGEHFNGRLDSTWIYNRKLTAEEEELF